MSSERYDILNDSLDILSSPSKFRAASILNVYLGS